MSKGLLLSWIIWRNSFFILYAKAVQISVNVQKINNLLLYKRSVAWRSCRQTEVVTSKSWSVKDLYFREVFVWSRGYTFPRNYCSEYHLTFLKGHITRCTFLLDRGLIIVSKWFLKGNIFNYEPKLRNYHFKQH